MVLSRWARRDGVCRARGPVRPGSAGITYITLTRSGFEYCSGSWVIRVLFVGKMGSRDGGEWARKDRPGIFFCCSFLSLVWISLHTGSSHFFSVSFFPFSTLLLFFSLILLRFRPLVQSPGHSDGWDGNGMKRRGKMRLDTSTAPEMGEREKSVETPFSRCLFLGLPGEGVTTTGPHTTTSSAECLNCRLEFESRVSDLWSRPGPTRSDLARACNVYA